MFALLAVAILRFVSTASAATLICYRDGLGNVYMCCINETGNCCVPNEVGSCGIEP